MQDIARGGSIPYDGLYGYLFQASGIWKGRELTS